VTLHEVCGLYVVCAHFDQCRSYAHEREFSEKCFISIMAMSLDYMFLSILLAMLVLKLWLSCLSMSQFSML
jgi:hypothetical protein